MARMMSLKEAWCISGIICHCMRTWEMLCNRHRTEAYTFPRLYDEQNPLYYMAKLLYYEKHGESRISNRYKVDNFTLIFKFNKHKYVLTYTYSKTREVFLLKIGRKQQSYYDWSHIDKAKALSGFIKAVAKRKVSGMVKIKGIESYF